MILKHLRGLNVYNSFALTDEARKLSVGCDSIPEIHYRNSALHDICSDVLNLNDCSE